MSLKVEIVCRETIKPSSPTPENKATFKLSLMDQICSKSYVPIILFYSPTSTIIEQENRSKLLKQSLSETLTHMYTLAGRVKDMYSIECKDQGVEYVESRVADSMSTVLNHPTLNQLRQLLPFDSGKVTSAEDVLLSVQVNDFVCGGTVIGVCISHIVVDLCAVSTFLKTWSDVARGERVEHSFVIECTAIFPPQDVSGLLDNLEIWKPKEQRRNRFIFSDPNIAALKEKATKAGECPSRVVAVSTFIWAAILGTNEGQNWAMAIPMNLRNRMDHSDNLQHSLGNMAPARVAMSDSKTEYGTLVKVVRDTIKGLTPEVVKTYQNQDYFAGYKKSIEAYVKYSDKMGVFKTSSWCRFPLYEVDFEWGKPVWVGTTYNHDAFGLLMDTSDGKGIEAWVTLPQEIMKQLEHNADFLAFISVVQSF